ncbi:hypothetical protein N7495_009947 [Penicillium taxi]|uniref:uncharacterized protein n=1 Tax=Penicillium taxi TaxID=168475 RepID=UPI002545A9BA|nr:uncharacterized protein N7495_009947 [Penicillium taxi]KAJ5885437.1 hypothetical protein N7495_009947 [Penicillium taxi]
MARYSAITLSLLAGSALATSKARSDIGDAIVDYPAIPKDLTTPTQQRVAIYGPDSVSVGWNTYEQLTEGCVEYGLSETNLAYKACTTNASTTYDTSRTWSNYAYLTSLESATDYYYKIVSTNSTVGHFLSPRKPGDTTPFNSSVVIDLGVYGKDGFTASSAKRDISDIFVRPELNHSTIGRLAANADNYEVVLHPGDFAYADDWYLKLKNILEGKKAYQSILEQFYGQLAPVSSSKLYMASPGNHEASCSEIPFLNDLCPEGQKNFTDFMHRYQHTMPQSFASSSTNTTAQALATQARSLSNPPFWYSFEYGMAHVVMIDTETDFPNAPDGVGGSQSLNSGPFGVTNQQIEFLKADLASVDRSVTPWLIVTGHRPFYSVPSSSGSSNVCTSCQEAFEDLYYQYGVDLGVFGHVHNSQRFAPIYNGTADPNGLKDPKAPMYIVAGGAGNIEGISSIGTKQSYNEFAYADDFSYATLAFESENELRVEFIRSNTGEVLDTSVLYKSHTEAFVDQ